MPPENEKKFFLMWAKGMAAVNLLPTEIYLLKVNHGDAKKYVKYVQS